ncbi:hypothetical protein O6P43_006191 [Quillaja saponaria]|uniref:Uncharacterized protein n=1 Tax=Quillaja saponaria TaxID=32244 RepID=A0AAD7Q7P6_QUISA|nr:hypothetical protein O6P43_006191 [Quillaja saponaria]
MKFDPKSISVSPPYILSQPCLQKYKRVIILDAVEGKKRERLHSSHQAFLLYIGPRTSSDQVYLYIKMQYCRCF